MERLENRSVLSVCGVECALQAGRLNIEGTSGDDLISVQYDSSTSLVRVVGGENELLGQFPVADLHSLYISGASGNDRFVLDANLPVGVFVNGGEGEDAIFSAVHAAGHSHGSSGAYDVEEFLPVPSAPLVPAVSASAASTVAPAGMALLSAALSLNASSPGSPSLASDHGSHDLGLRMGTDAGHHSLAGGAMATTGSAVDMHEHLLAGGVSSSLGLATIAAAAGGALTAKGVVSDDAQALAQHSRHAAPGVSGEVSAKVAPKRCTTTYVARELNRSIYGERKCDCAKKLAAKEAARRAAAGSNSRDAKPLALNCVPCQQSAMWASSPGDLDFCMMGLNVALEDVLDARDEQPETTAVPSSSAADPVDANESSTTGLRIAGYALVAGGAALLPLLWKPKRKNAVAVDGVMALDLDWVADRCGCGFAA